MMSELEDIIMGSLYAWLSLSLPPGKPVHPPTRLLPVLAP